VKQSIVILVMLFASSALFPSTQAITAGKPGKSLPYSEVIQKTAWMVSDGNARMLAQQYGLQVLNVTWEDTGRYKGSSVGPNISDMTIQVQEKDPSTGQYRLTCMPVIRHPNYGDLSADISPDRFYILVGNEKGGRLRKVTLRQYLDNPRNYMSAPASWKGWKKSLLAKRDTHVLVSAQACFLPVPRKGIAEFNPVLFNYQSYEGDPAVLTILATREGTSMTVIDNKRDGFQAGVTWGQRLFFNHKGERASLTGKRLSDFIASGNSGKKGNGAKHSATAAGESGLNLVLLIQVPLKQKVSLRRKDMMCEESKADNKAAPSGQASDVEAAVIGHGKVEGPFTEIAGLAIERDERYPIRVTVQFYKATGNGVVSEADIREIKGQIQRVYKQADYVGSLVVDGDTGRPTEYDGPKNEPSDWWDTFWKRHRDNTGMTPPDTMLLLRRLFGPNWKPREM
jgi:hypothetical protein